MIILTTKVQSPKKMGLGATSSLAPVAINSDHINFFEYAQPGTPEHEVDDDVLRVVLTSGVVLYIKISPEELIDKWFSDTITGEQFKDWKAGS